MIKLNVNLATIIESVKRLCVVVLSFLILSYCAPLTHTEGLILEDIAEHIIAYELDHYGRD